MAFSKAVAQAVLVRSGRCCCVCHRFCGSKIELHHIIAVEQGGDDSFENCIPVCFDCHADIGNYNEKHPRGRRYYPDELRQHRDQWFARKGGAKQVVEGTLTANGVATSTTFIFDEAADDTQISFFPLTPEAAALLGKCWISKENGTFDTYSSESQVVTFTVNHPALLAGVVATFRFSVSGR